MVESIPWLIPAGVEFVLTGMVPRLLIIILSIFMFWLFFVFVFSPLLVHVPHNFLQDTKILK